MTKTEEFADLVRKLDAFISTEECAGKLNGGTFHIWNSTTSPLVELIINNLEKE